MSDSKQKMIDERNGFKMRQIRAKARICYNGHFCILSVIDGYKGCYGQPTDFRSAIGKMMTYQSYSQLLTEMVNNPTDFEIKNLES